jgi:hypothetical protein
VLRGELLAQRDDGRPGQRGADLDGERLAVALSCARSRLGSATVAFAFVAGHRP